MQLVKNEKHFDEENIIFKNKAILLKVYEVLLFPIHPDFVKEMKLKTNAFPELKKKFKKFNDENLTYALFDRLKTNFMYHSDIITTLHLNFFFNFQVTNERITQLLESYFEIFIPPFQNLQESGVLSESSDEDSIRNFSPVTHPTTEDIPSRVTSQETASTSAVNRNTLALPAVAKVCDRYGIASAVLAIVGLVSTEDPTLVVDENRSTVRN
ncbi:unnamed protein product [Ceratitis capitata]|uniref:(Mediterranean fruit fly) hypothetical protein n=1 Tax=Ceratitis capitata TaxID=7213 RepID=A0A811U1P5_CERCA|nr:unnamed protein product [Ceratitis capitata]